MYIDISNVSMEIFVESLDLKNSQKNSKNFSNLLKQPQQ